MALKLRLDVRAKRDLVEIRGHLLEKARHGVGKPGARSSTQALQALADEADAWS